MRVFALDVAGGTLAPPQPAGWAHLVTLRSGVATVRSRRTRLLLEPDVAAWIPAGNAYALDFAARSELRVLYLTAAPERPLGPVRTTPLLHGLIDRAASAGFLDPAEPRHRRLLAVLADEIAALAPIADRRALTSPRATALQAAVARGLAASDEFPRMAALAAVAGMSLRTFERAFARETGLAPATWFRRARLVSAAIDVRAGASVTEAAMAAGYASVSAFIAAYRAAFGSTPGGYRARSRVTLDAR